MKKTVDFIGIGVFKCASTWVSHCLQQHPDILLSSEKSVKEVNFFNSGQSGCYNLCLNTNYQKGLKWYLKQFPPPQPGKIRGEFSVCYFRDKKAPARIKKHFPQAKIIVTLRNPADMAYSLYWLVKARIRFKPPKDFAKAVNQGQFETLCLKEGLYYQHLKRYYQRFPRKNIHVILLDEIINQPEKVIKDLYRFLNVSKNFVPPALKSRVYPAVSSRSDFLKTASGTILSLLNLLGFSQLSTKLLNNDFLYRAYVKANLVRKKYPPLKIKTKKILKDYYADDIKKLEKLIRRDLSDWY